MTSSAATFSDIEQVFEFSFNNKYTWKHNKNTHKSMKNCRNHVYKHLGNRFPIEKTDQGAMDYLYDLMVEQDASNTLFNRCKTALQRACFTLNQNPKTEYHSLSYTKKRQSV